MYTAAERTRSLSPHSPVTPALAAAPHADTTSRASARQSQTHPRSRTPVTKFSTGFCNHMEIRMSRTVSSFALAAAFLIASSLAEHSTTAITDVDRDDAKKQTDELDKYQNVRGGMKQLREPETYLERLLSDELEKRASMRGFQGMRGKKSAAYYTGQSANPADRLDSYYYGPYSDFYSAKRAPMGFQGMRGKKSAVDDYKRAPMGFQGMRGKKSLEEVLDELDKRAMMGFQGMRGKKSEDYEELPEEPSDISEWSKRAPMGFQGMRGRKSFLDELDELEKRALLGFHGMRGKKDMYEREDAPVELDNYAKRPMMMGFHGMRGKRSASYYAVPEKRTAYRFFGSRGKKNPRWELRGKFVGVRGKKWTGAPRTLAERLLLLRRPAYLLELTEDARGPAARH